MNDLPDTSLVSSINDSFDLDFSDLSTDKKSKKTNKKSKKNKDDDDDDDDSELENGVSAIVPVKGQKLAARRVKKIGGMYV